MPYVIAVHGGAGTIARDDANQAPYHEGLSRALRAGQAVLAAGGRALDAAQAAVMALEDDPLFNAGRGSVYTSARVQEMDAALMDGATLAAGAVAGVRSVRNPVALARAVLDEGGPLMLIAEGAEAFAGRHGFERMPPEYFASEQRLAQLLRVQAAQSATPVLDHTGAAVERTPLDESRKLGTVGAVALDLSGHLAAAVSTGGMTNKRPGRVGDSPIVGAGLYANDATCAVACTGTGEMFIRAVAAHDVHARMLYAGASLDEAANDVVMRSLPAIRGEGGLIAVDRAGNLALPFNSAGMYRGWLRQGGAPETAIFR
jgi:beta-aspartyl-peptidase (threonine type)